MKKSCYQKKRSNIAKKLLYDFTHLKKSHCFSEKKKVVVSLKVLIFFQDKFWSVVKHF